MAGLHSNVCAGISHSNNKNALVPKYIWMFILSAVEILAFKSIYTYGKKGSQIESLQDLWMKDTYYLANNILLMGDLGCFNSILNFKKILNMDT